MPVCNNSILKKKAPVIFTVLAPEFVNTLGY